MLSPSLLAFFKESKQPEYFEKVFINLIPSSSTTLYILNAHLVTEELIFKLIQHVLRDPGALSATDLTYQKKCVMLKALYGDTLAEWLYPALAQLGTLRNKCAHVLDHPKLDEAITLFIKAAYERSPNNEALLTETRGKGYYPGPNCSDSDLQYLEETAQKCHDIGFRLPMGCERIIEYLLRKWHGLQTAP